MTKNPVVLAVILIVLVLVIVLMTRPSGPEKSGTVETALYPDLDTSLVDRIALREGDTVAEFRRSDGVWVVATQDGFPADPDAMGRLLSETARLTRDEVASRRPEKYRRFYRNWRGPEDALAPNEALCPVCKIVVRSTRELRPGDRIYCMACMTRLQIVRSEAGHLEARVVY